jgi:predicted secreted protein
MRFPIFLAAALSASLGWLVPAAAGDTASVNVLGFTPDGRVFAFEEYGVQDGSGFPYAHRFYIDSATDTFMPETPIRVLLEDESQTVQAARQQAKVRGEKLFKDAVLDRNRGDLVAFNAVTEDSADPHRIVANPRPFFPPIVPALEFRLEEFSMPPPERCEGMGKVAGFRLIRMDPQPNGPIKLLHEDANLPLSRGCPNGYRLGGLQTFFPENGAPVYAILISIRSYGFEGPDFRWIAATGRL